jgi:hypothetical protein
MRRYFSFLVINDAYTKRCLNAALFIADPRQKWPAHITIGGPYTSEPKKKEFAGKISVIGVNNFFSDGQNTVYLTVGGEGLRAVWDKSDYGYNPHLTIYDGSNTCFAASLFEKLNSQKIYFYFDVAEYFVAQSTARQSHLFGIVEHVDSKFLEREFTKVFNCQQVSKLNYSDLIKEVEQLSEFTRLEMVDHLISLAASDPGRRALQNSAATA